MNEDIAESAMDSGHGTVQNNGVIDLILGPTGIDKSGIMGTVGDTFGAPQLPQAMSEDPLRALGSLQMLATTAHNPVHNMMRHGHFPEFNQAINVSPMAGIATSNTTTVGSNSGVVEKIELSADGSTKHNVAFEFPGADRPWFEVNYPVNSNQSEVQKVTDSSAEQLIPENMIKSEKMDEPAEIEYMDEVENGVNKFDCAVCGRVFRRAEDLAKHKHEAHKKKYPCEICGQVFRWVPDLTRHMHEHSEMNLPEIPFPQNTQIKQEPESNKTKGYSCEFCGKTFSWMPDLTRHTQDHIDQNYALGQSEAKHTCHICFETFTKKNGLTRHMKVHKELLGTHNQTGEQKKVIIKRKRRTEGKAVPGKRGKYNKEEKVGKVRKGDKRGSLVTKIVKNQVVSTVNTKEKTIFSCDRCDQTFNFESRLKRHMKTHKKARIPDEEDPTLKVKIVGGEKVFGCIECEKTFAKKFDLRAHFRTHSGERPYKCDSCDKTFIRPQHLLAHKKYHLYGKPYPCNVCNKGFFAKARLLAHKCSGADTQDTLNYGSQDPNSNNNPSFQTPQKQIIGNAQSTPGDFACDVCNKVFNSRIHLRDHTRVHTRTRDHICTECGKAFLSASHLKQHGRTHTGEKTYLCQICSKSFFTMSNLKYHMMSHVEGPGSFACQQCSKVYKHPDILRKHVKRVHSEKHICEQCGTECESRSHLNSHRRSHRTGIQGDSKGPVICEFCGKMFRCQSELNRHSSVHTGEKPHQCNTCGQRFRLVASLRRHEISHTGERPHICDQCGSTFMWKGDLNTHKNKYHNKSNRGSFKCSQCGRMFTCLIYMKFHKMRVHMEKRYKCKLCGSAFYLNSDLTKHIKNTHSDDIYHCPYCGKSFNRKNTLEKHEKKCRTGEADTPKRATVQRFKIKKSSYTKAKVPCPQCDAILPGVLALKTHIKCHQGYQMLNCPVCEREFTKPFNLKRHIASYHKDYDMSNTTPGRPGRRKKRQSSGHETDQSVDEEFYHLTPGYLTSTMIQNILPPSLTPLAPPRSSMVVPSTSSATSPNQYGPPVHPVVHTRHIEHSPTGQQEPMFHGSTLGKGSL